MRQRVWRSCRDASIVTRERPLMACTLVQSFSFMPDQQDPPLSLRLAHSPIVVRYSLAIELDARYAVYTAMSCYLDQQYSRECFHHFGPNGGFRSNLRIVLSHDSDIFWSMTFDIGYLDTMIYATSISLSAPTNNC
jgi:hypothetical protein